jgi:hypothetical protein
MRIVEQFVDRNRIIRQLDALGAPRATLAVLVGVSPGSLSLWFSRQRAFSIEAQKAVLEVMEFLRELRETATIPVDLSDAAALKPVLERFRHQRLESRVIKTEAELARAAGESK